MWDNRAVSQERLPRRYQLSYEPFRFRFGLSAPVVEYLFSNREMLAEAAIRLGFEDFGLDGFSFSEEGFGFKGKVGFRRQDSVIAEGLLTYRLDLKEAAQRQEMTAQTATLQLINLFISWVEDLDEKNWPEQLLTFYACLGRGLSSYALAAWTSLAVRQWIEECFNEKLMREIEKALVDLDGVLNPPYPGESKRYRISRRQDFLVRKNPGRGFMVVVPGNACDLAVYPDRYLPDDWGLEFDSHNVDSSSQQFLFLVALAMVCDAIESGPIIHSSAVGK